MTHFVIPEVILQKEQKLLYNSSSHDYYFSLFRYLNTSIINEKT